MVYFAQSGVPLIPGELCRLSSKCKSMPLESSLLKKAVCWFCTEEVSLEDRGSFYYLRKIRFFSNKLLL